MIFFSRASLLIVLLTMTLSVKSQVNRSTKPYSSFRISNGLIFISGQIGISKRDSGVAHSSFEIEVIQAMQNLKTVLNESESDLSSVINVVVYLRNMDQYTEFNSIYLKYFEFPFPSRSCVAVKELASGANVEISAVAVQKKHRRHLAATIKRKVNRTSNDR